MTTLYLDWNVFLALINRNNITFTTDKKAFQTFYKLLHELTHDFIIPFSNAHLQDLYNSYERGEIKNIDAALEFIKNLTSSVCITQYHNQRAAKFHEREPAEFYHAIKKKLNETVQYNVLLNNQIKTMENTIMQLNSGQLPKPMPKSTFTELHKKHNERNYKQNIDYGFVTGLYIKNTNNENRDNRILNEALHCFYAAHAHIYFTSEKNIELTTAVFEKQHISTVVLSPTEFIGYFSEESLAFLQ